jgi:hypothetical protein
MLLHTVSGSALRERVSWPRATASHGGTKITKWLSKLNRMTLYALKVRACVNERMTRDNTSVEAVVRQQA